MKKGTSASKRAVAELLTNGTDNNKDARCQNAEGKDKREELKKDFFECGESFDPIGAVSDNSNGNAVNKLSAEAAFDDAVIMMASKTEQISVSAEKEAFELRAAAAVISADGERSMLSGTKAIADGARPMRSGAKATAEGVRPVQSGAKATAEGVRPVQSGAKATAEGVRPVQSGAKATAEGVRPVQSGAKATAEGVRPVQSGAKATAEGVRPVQSGAKEIAEGVRPVQAGSKISADEVRADQSRAAATASGIPIGVPGEVFSRERTASGEKRAVPNKRTAKHNKGKNKILSVAAAIMSAFVVVAVGAGVYLYLNRGEEFVPADLVAGNIAANTEVYSELLSAPAVSYLTEERYNIKFTFYEQPEIVCTTTETTVGELMNKLGITVGENNRCSMTSDAVLSADGTVDIQTITYETVSTEEAIPYETEYVDVRTIPKGTTEVSENGKNGVKTYTYKCTLVNGVEESRELISEKVTTKPKSRVMYRGVGGTITSQGRTYNYSYYIDVKATVYNIIGMTASGLPTGINVMAVDPKVIPLGTKCVVAGGGGDYGYRIAADTGGNIKGNKIDLWYPAGTYSGFGWRSTRVYILE